MVLILCEEKQYIFIKFILYKKNILIKTSNVLAKRIVTDIYAKLVEEKVQNEGVKIEK
jgi:hypothetical protein